MLAYSDYEPFFILGGILSRHLITSNTHKKHEKHEKHNEKLLASIFPNMYSKVCLCFCKNLHVPIYTHFCTYRKSFTRTFSSNVEGFRTSHRALLSRTRFLSANPDVPLPPHNVIWAKELLRLMYIFSSMLLDYLITIFKNILLTFLLFSRMD